MTLEECKNLLTSFMARLDDKSNTTATLLHECKTIIAALEKALSVPQYNNRMQFRCMEKFEETKREFEIILKELQQRLKTEEALSVDVGENAAHAFLDAAQSLSPAALAAAAPGLTSADVDSGVKAANDQVDPNQNWNPKGRRLSVNSTNVRIASGLAFQLELVNAQVSVVNFTTSKALKELKLHFPKTLEEVRTEVRNAKYIDKQLGKEEVMAKLIHDLDMCDTIEEIKAQIKLRDEDNIFKIVINTQQQKRGELLYRFFGRPTATALLFDELKREISLPQYILKQSQADIQAPDEQALSEAPGMQ